MHVKGDIEYANVYNDGIISVDAEYYPVSTHPPKPQDFFWGPAGWANRQSNLRQYFNIGGENVIWQDIETNRLRMTNFGPDKATHIELKVYGGFTLGAAVQGENGEIFYIIIQDGEPSDKASTRAAVLFKINERGEILKE